MPRYGTNRCEFSVQNIPSISKSIPSIAISKGCFCLNTPRMCQNLPASLPEKPGSRAFTAVSFNTLPNGAHTHPACRISQPFRSRKGKAHPERPARINHIAPAVWKIHFPNKKMPPSFGQFKTSPYLCTRKQEVHPSRRKGAIAQLVEQRTENPCVPGSIPGGTTLKKSN